MKSVVVQSYYQLLHAIAWNLGAETRPLLFVSRSYIRFSDDIIERIKRTEVFSDVIVINEPGDLSPFSYRLYLTKFLPQKMIDKIGSSLFDTYLMPYYRAKFEPADKDDEIFIYNDYHWFFYYVSKTFSRITEFEDGYDSITQQLAHPDVQNLKIPGYNVRRRYVPKYYPAQVYRDESISRIVVNKYSDELPDFVKNKLEVADFRDVAARHGERFTEIVRSLFDVDFDTAENGARKTALIIGQAIAANRFASLRDDYLLHKKMIADSLKEADIVYVKPHPAETLDFRVFASERVRILPKEFPVELLNSMNFHVDTALTYSSTAAGTISCADSVETILPSRAMDYKSIKAHIAAYIEGVDFSVDKYAPDSDADYVIVCAGEPSARLTRVMTAAVSRHAPDMKALIFPGRSCRLYRREGLLCGNGNLCDAAALGEAARNAAGEKYHHLFGVTFRVKGGLFRKFLHVIKMLTTPPCDKISK
ncbi:MAG: glycosyltransferase family 52 protein [Clostridiales Family XIII bacterium]|jgi:hypothetical protein|nr:glycosyltransferase family 52 protein [Clostridiales Family XIII bacterium]